LIKTILKYFLVAVFLLSAITKLLDYNATVELFENLLGLSIIHAKIILSVLILIELVIAYLIIADYLQIKIVYLLICGLITVFLFASILFAVKGYTNCGCFGADIISSPKLSIVKNILLLLTVLYLRYPFSHLRLSDKREVSN